MDLKFLLNRLERLLSSAFAVFRGMVDDVKHAVHEILHRSWRDWHKRILIVDLLIAFYWILNVPWQGAALGFFGVIAAVFALSQDNDKMERALFVLVGVVLLAAESLAMGKVQVEQALDKANASMAQASLYKQATRNNLLAAESLKVMTGHESFPTVRVMAIEDDRAQLYIHVEGKHGLSILNVAIRRLGQSDEFLLERPGYVTPGENPVVSYRETGARHGYVSIGSSAGFLYTITAINGKYHGSINFTLDRKGAWNANWTANKLGTRKELRGRFP